ncbi:MAG: LacI family DNA-binding transcriptional regulator [Kineosporiaceae bacterium]
MTTRRVTLLDVARRAGVSVTTVSRVVNEGPNVRPDVRERVRAAVAELGYRPHPVARSLRSGRDATIGVVVDSLADIFFATIADTVERLAVPRGLAVTIGTSGRDHEREHGLVELFLERQVAGLVLVPVADSPGYLPLLGRGTPAVFVDRPVAGPFDAVIGDDHGGALRGTSHLLDHGHRRIAFLGDSTLIHTSRARLDGYRQALAAAGVPVADEIVVTGCPQPPEAAAAVERLLAADAPPTAIFSSNMRCTVGAVSVLHSRARTDVAVVGFGDFPLADVLDPAVTVLDQDPVGVATRATRRLFDHLDGTAAEEPVTSVVPVHLVPRGSGELPCAPS